MPPEFDSIKRYSEIEDGIVDRMAVSAFGEATTRMEKDGDDASEWLALDLSDSLLYLLKSDSILKKLKKALGTPFNEELYLDQLEAIRDQVRQFYEIM